MDTLFYYYTLMMKKDSFNMYLYQWTLRNILEYAMRSKSRHSRYRKQLSILCLLCEEELGYTRLLVLLQDKVKRSLINPCEGIERLCGNISLHSGFYRASKKQDLSRTIRQYMLELHPRRKGVSVTNVWLKIKGSKYKHISFN